MQICIKEVEILLNESIKKRRTELGISRKKLCSDLCSESTLYRFEMGLSDINAHLLIEICKRLKLGEVVITDVNFTEKEYVQFLLIQHYIYQRNITELEKIIESAESKSKVWTKIITWCQAVIYFYKGEYKRCENIISKDLSISKPKNSLDLLILNTLILSHLSQNSYKEALEVATTCINYIETHRVGSTELNFKIRYSYAHSLHQNGNKKEAETIILELIDALIHEKTFFLLGKCYFFLYALHKDEKVQLSNKYLKMSYMTFIIENSPIPNQVLEEIKKLPDSSLFL